MYIRTVFVTCKQLHSLGKVLKKTSNTQGDAVAKAFMDTLVAIIGGYQSALKLRPVSIQYFFFQNQCICTLLYICCRCVNQFCIFCLVGRERNYL